jgi:glycosyltransferase involved in cell wall biosynthesis
VPDHPKPIKVVQVIARMNVGGPAVLIDIVHRGLDQHEFDAQLWTGDVEPGEIDHLLTKGTPDRVRKIVGLGRSVKAAGDLRAFITLVRLLRAERPDVVHTHTAKAGMLGRLAAIVARVPVRIHTFHGHVLHGYFSPRVTRAITVLERLLATRTTALVAVGAHVRDDLLAAGIGRADQYTVVAPGVSITAPVDKIEARSRLGLPTDAPIVMFVGRLTRIKRPDRLLESFRVIREHVPDVLLVIAGEGDLFDETQSTARDLGDSVRFLGWQADLGAVYPAADVEVLTSDNEGMPVTLIEASMLGIPCVTTDVGSAGEVVLDQRTGFVVDKDPTAIARAVEEILSNAELAARLSTEARSHAEARFGSARLVNDHTDLYRAAMNRRQGR